MVKKGHTVTIIASNFNHKTREYHFDDTDALEKGREEIINGVRFIWLPATQYSGNGVKRGLGMFTFLFKALGVKKKFGLDRPDVIVGSSPTLITALAANLLSTRLKSSFVMEVRDVHPASLIEISGYSKWHPLIVFFSMIEQFLYRQADVIISVLPKLLDHVSRHGVTDNTFFVVSNGVDIERFNLQEKQPDDEFSIMYTGAMALGNDIIRPIRAMALLSEEECYNRKGQKIVLRLIGNGPERPALEKSAKELGVSGTRVRFEASVPQTKIASVMASADSFIILLKDCSLWLEHGISPNKINDYLASGRPTVTIFSSANNPIAEADAGIALEGDASDLEIAKAFLELANLPGDRHARMGANGHDAARNRHSFSALSETFEIALRTAIERFDGHARRGTPHKGSI